MTTKELRAIRCILIDESAINKVSIPAWVWACQVRKEAGLKQHGLYNQCAYWHVREDVLGGGGGGGRRLPTLS